MVPDDGLKVANGGLPDGDLKVANGGLKLASDGL